MHATLIGYLGKDAEWKPNEKGGYGFVSMAVTQKKIDRGVERDVTTWVTVWFFNPKITEFLKKGQQIVASGRLIYELTEYQGKPKITSDLNTREGYIHFVGPKREDSEPQNPFVKTPATPEATGQVPAYAQPQNTPPLSPNIPAAKNLPAVPSEDDDLPF